MNELPIELIIEIFEKIDLKDTSLFIKLSKTNKLFNDIYKKFFEKTVKRYFEEEKKRKRNRIVRGGIMSLISYGAQDIYLLGDNTNRFFNF